jgi:hypothetical protein
MIKVPDDGRRLYIDTSFCLSESDVHRYNEHKTKRDCEWHTPIVTERKPCTLTHTWQASIVHSTWLGHDLTIPNDPRVKANQIQSFTNDSLSFLSQWFSRNLSVRRHGETDWDDSTYFIGWSTHSCLLRKSTFWMATSGDTRTSNCRRHQIRLSV